MLSVCEVLSFGYHLKQVSSWGHFKGGNMGRSRDLDAALPA